MGPVVDHLVVGSADLDVGVRWVEQRLGVAPMFGGVHVGVGTRNALLGLGDPYLEVLSLASTGRVARGRPAFPTGDGSHRSRSRHPSRRC